MLQSVCARPLQFMESMVAARDARQWDTQQRRRPPGVCLLVITVGISAHQCCADHWSRCRGAVGAWLAQASDGQSPCGTAAGFPQFVTRACLPLTAATTGCSSTRAPGGATPANLHPCCGEDILWRSCGYCATIRGTQAATGGYAPPYYLAGGQPASSDVQPE